MTIYRLCEEGAYPSRYYEISHLPDIWDLLARQAIDTTSKKVQKIRQDKIEKDDLIQFSRILEYAKHLIDTSDLDFKSLTMLKKDDIKQLD